MKFFEGLDGLEELSALTDAATDKTAVARSCERCDTIPGQPVMQSVSLEPEVWKWVLLGIQSGIDLIDGRCRELRDDKNDFGPVRTREADVLLANYAAEREQLERAHTSISAIIRNSRQ